MTVPPSPAGQSPTASDVARTLRLLRERVPLVHNITNLVVADSTANALPAIGASPCMVEAAEEAPGFAAVADALVINLGTVMAETARSMRAAAAAHGSGTPWVLDPVAVGALGFRPEVAVGLLAHRPQAIRGSASEILALEAMSSPGERHRVAAGREVESARKPPQPSAYD